MPNKSFLKENPDCKALVLDDSTSNLTQFQMILEDYFSYVFKSKDKLNAQSIAKSNQLNLFIIDEKFSRAVNHQNLRSKYHISNSCIIVISLNKFNNFESTNFDNNLILIKPITRSKVEDLLVSKCFIHNSERRNFANLEYELLPHLKTRLVNSRHIFYNYRLCPNLLVEVCEFYISKVDDIILRIKKAAEDKDSQSLKSIYRTIKGIFNFFDYEFQTILADYFRKNNEKHIEHGQIYLSDLIELVKEINLDIKLIYNFLKKNHYINTNQLKRTHKHHNHHFEFNETLDDSLT